MPQARTPRKAATPGSVKALMIIEASAIGFFSFWLYSEYFYNAYFRTYVDSVFLAHITTYTAVIGLSIGLVGSAVTLTLWRSLRQARLRLESATPPRIKGSMERILSGMSAIDEYTPVPPVKRAVSVIASVPPPAAPVKATQPSELERK